MPPRKRQKKQQVAAPVPPLPPAVTDEDVHISDEDVEFVRSRKDFAGFLVNLDTNPLTRQVLGLDSGRKKDGEDLEAKYESTKLREKIVAEKASVDSVDVLPVKTLSGELRYRLPKDADSGQSAEPSTNGTPEGKEEKKPKAAKKKEAKKVKKKLEQVEIKEDVFEENPKILDVVETALERQSRLQVQMAESGTALLEEPNENIMRLKEFQELCLDRDEVVAQLAMLSTFVVFKDIVPGYRIRLPTEKEMAMSVSNEVRLLRDYETALLRFYQAYVQLLIKNAKLRAHRWTALKCLCGLLEAIPHFNYRESILAAVVRRMGSDDDTCSSLCCEAVKSLFKNPGKHGDDATVEAVQLIADYVRLQNCHLRPEVIQVLVGLSFDSDLIRQSGAGASGQEARQKRANKLSKREAKREKKAKKRELASKFRKEVEADFREAEALPSDVAQKKSQMLILTSLFETYFRILKSSVESSRKPSTPEKSVETPGSKPSGHRDRPLLQPCLEGLARFSHLINVDFMADLLKVLQELAKGGGASVWERLLCCTVAFKIVRMNLDALNIDLRDFYVVFYNILFEITLIRDEEKHEKMLAQALQTILWDNVHNDMHRVAAFVKRLATLALHLRSGDTLAVLVTLQQLLVRYKKCRSMLQSSSGPSAVSSLAVLPSGDEDPDLSDAYSTSLWELTLLAKHSNPDVAKYSSTIVGLSSSTSSVMPAITPEAAVGKFSSSASSMIFQPLPTTKLRKQTRSLSQGWSSSFSALEEAQGLTLQLGTPTVEEIHQVEEVLGRHFRVLKACQARPKRKRRVKKEN